MWKPWQYDPDPRNTRPDPKPLHRGGWYITHPRYGTRGQIGTNLPFADKETAQAECIRRERILIEQYATGDNL